MNYRELFAQRIGGPEFGSGTNLFKFEKIKAARREAMKMQPDRKIFDLGIGEPDWPADPPVIEELYRAASDPANRGYTDNGIDEFKAAAALYMQNVFKVEGLDPDTEINHGIGSKSILAILPSAFINPGDILLRTTPGYPVMGTAAEALGGRIVNLPLLEENGFLPDFSMLSKEECRQAKMLYLNYPNNPTGAIATKDFYKQVIEFALQNNVFVVSDEAYAALVYDGIKPLSFLSVDGAKEVGVSVQSLSKAYNMTGWRLGFIAGNKNAVKAFRVVKDTRDSGQFAAIQHAGIYCLRHPEITERTVRKYSSRLELLAEMLNSLGFRAIKPKGTFYLYVQAPKATTDGETFDTAESFSLYLLRKHGISIVPWDDAGRFLRFSVTWQGNSKEDDVKFIESLYERMAKTKYIF